MLILSPLEKVPRRSIRGEEDELPGFWHQHVECLFFEELSLDSCNSLSSFLVATGTVVCKMCSRKCKTNQLAKSASSASISFPLTLKKSKSSFIHYIDASDSESDDCSGDAAGSTSSDSSDEGGAVLRRSHSLKRRESFHKQPQDFRTDKPIEDLSFSRSSSFVRPRRTELKANHPEERQNGNVNDRVTVTGDDLADELTKLSKKLEEIESRLVKNERRTDKELRKLYLKRQKESLETVHNVSRRDSEKGGDIAAPVATGFAALKRSATDFFRVKSRLHTAGSAEDCRAGGIGGRGKANIVSLPPSASTSAVQDESQQTSSNSPVKKGSSRQKLSQRLHKSSSSVLRAAASGIPSIVRPHLKSEKKSQDYSSIDSVNNCSINSSTGSKNKLSSVSATSLSAEEEAFDRCYQHRSRRSPLRAFVDDKILRRKHVPTRLRDSLDSSASGNSHVGPHSGNGSCDSDSGQPFLDLSYPGSSRFVYQDEVFEADARPGRANSTKLPPTPEGKKARKYRAYSTPNSRQVATTANIPLLPATLSPTADDPEASSDSAASNARTAITPDILAEIEMYRYMAFQRMAKEFQARGRDKMT